MNRGKKAITIYDIAEALGVSSATVSRALKNNKSIGAATTKAVQEMANRMGYHPNKMASSLRTKKTKTIGVIFSWINRPFISSVISGIEDIANQEGYNVIISQSNDFYKKEVSNAHTLLSSRVDGLIVSLAMETTQYDHFNTFLQNNIPVVFVDRICPDLDTDRIIIDNFDAGYTATKHLIDQGFRQIAHLEGAQNRLIFKERKEGYVAALRDHGIEINEDLILYSRLSYEEGWQSMEKLLRGKTIPKALFCSTDNAAIGALQCLKSKGLRVPHDVAIIGFNDDPTARIIDPPLTTISQPSVEMGRIAAQQVIKKRPYNESVKSETIILKTKLVIRGSSVIEDVRAFYP